MPSDRAEDHFPEDGQAEDGRAEDGRAEEARRGREVSAPVHMPRRGWKDVGMRVGARVVEDHVSVIAGGIAFFVLLALVPSLAAFISVAGLLFAPGTVTAQIAQMEGLVPASVLDLLQGQAQAIAARGQDGLSVAALTSLAVALWSASRGVNNLIEGLNLAHAEAEKRRILTRNAVALGLTVLLILLALVALGVIVGLPAALALIGFSDGVDALLTAASFVLLALVFMVSLGLIYRYGPSRRSPQWAWVTPGAIGATVLWLVASAGFTLYVSNFGSYNDTYGALGGVVILLLWLWVSCFIVLLGAQINAELEHQTRIDTTRGRARPMGQRGAYMADTLGDVSK